MKKASACDKIVSHPRLKKGNQKELKMKKKYLFYVTGFFSGLSVMAIELGASRLMAPYFSSSQIIWTIIIGTIMIAMALGNILGGKMADKIRQQYKQVNDDEIVSNISFGLPCRGYMDDAYPASR